MLSRGRSLSLCFGALFALAIPLVPASARAACVTPPSPTQICVTFDNGADAYTVDTGAGPVVRGALSMTIGTTYSFELDPAEATDFDDHPFYLSDSAAGAGIGKTLAPPISTGTLTFTPTAATPLKSYYQCSFHTLMGGTIDVPGGAPPAVPPTVTDGGGGGHGGHGDHDAGEPEAGASNPPQDGGPGNVVDSGGVGNGAPEPAASPDGTRGDGGCVLHAGEPADGIHVPALAMLVVAGALARRRRRL